MKRNELWSIIVSVTLAHVYLFTEDYSELFSSMKNLKKIKLHLISQEYSRIEQGIKNFNSLFCNKQLISTSLNVNFKYPIIFSFLNLLLIIDCINTEEFSLIFCQIEVPLDKFGKIITKCSTTKKFRFFDIDMQPYASEFSYGEIYSNNYRISASFFLLYLVYERNLEIDDIILKCGDHNFLNFLLYCYEKEKFEYLNKISEIIFRHERIYFLENSLEMLEPKKGEINECITKLTKLKKLVYYLGDENYNLIPILLSIDNLRELSLICRDHSNCSSIFGKVKRPTVIRIIKLELLSDMSETLTYFDSNKELFPFLEELHVNNVIHLLV